MSNEGFRVTERVDNAHPKLADYPLLPGDLLVRDGETWTKEAPGLAVLGFTLTPEQEATLTRVEFSRHGLAYTILSGDIA